MGNIQDLLAQILSARYGRDVRQSIHDAIETCYEDGHAGSIDLEARADIASLDTRVETLNNNLATLFSDGTYTGNIDNIKKTSFVWVDFTVVTGTLPKTESFGIICTFKISQTIFVQAEFDYYGTVKTPCIRYRVYANNQWYKWSEFTGTLLGA